MIDDALINDLKHGRWERNCLRITLRQNDSSEPRIFSGPGVLRQGHDGIIQYTVFDALVCDPNVWHEQFHGLVEGKLIEKRRYFRIEAVDYHGICWRCEQTMPDIDVIEEGGRVHYVVNGTIHELSSSGTLSQGGCNVEMVFFAKTAIPCNVRTVCTTSVGCQPAQTSYTLNVAEFTTSFGTFCISNDSDQVVVKVNSPSTELPRIFEERIVEALSFVLAKRLDWNVVNRCENGTETIRIRSEHFYTANSRGIHPPVGVGRVDTNGEIWRLFDQYLAFICSYSRDEFHPCSRYFFAVLRANWVAISSLALALSVAVEGIVENLFPTAGCAIDPSDVKRSTDLKSSVGELRDYIAKWPGFEDTATPPSLKKRVNDLLNHILEVNVKSKLIALVKDKVILESHEKAWSKLRHPSAHAKTAGGGDLQTLANLCDAVTVLIYHLIFKAIGFEGTYIDYSTPGWPAKHYRGRPLTQEDIALAAYFIWEQSDRKHGNDLDHWHAAQKQLEEGRI